MSGRSRSPTDREPTAVYDGDGAPGGQALPLPPPPAPPRPPPAQAGPLQAQARPRTPTKRGAGIEIATPTEMTPPRLEPGARASTAPPAQERSGPAQAAPMHDGVVQAAPVQAVAPAQAWSEPLRVISLKAPGEGRGDRSEPSVPVRQHQPRLRPLSEVSQQRHAAHTPPGGLGYLAPPRDPKEAQARRWREYVVWGSVVVMLAGVVTLGVWFLAGM
jgi:hypothetical protein